MSLLPDADASNREEPSRCLIIPMQHIHVAGSMRASCVGEMFAEFLASDTCLGIADAIFARRLTLPTVTPIHPSFHTIKTEET